VRRHELDLTSLVAGVIFMGIGATFLVDLAVDVALDPRWLAPVMLIAIGLAGLLGSLPTRQPAQDEPGVDVEDTVDDPLSPR